jgi:hypothetical protein
VRAAFGLLVGIAVGGPFLAILLAAAPPGHVGKAALLGGLMILATGGIAFLWEDAVDATVALEDGGIRRRTKPLFFNLFGMRTRNDFWDYRAIAGCGFAPDRRLGDDYAALVVALTDRADTLAVPRKVHVDQVAAFLTSKGVRVQTLAEVPPHALPRPSVGGRGLAIGGGLAVASMLLAAAGGLSRGWIHGERDPFDAGAVREMLLAAPAQAPLREFTGIEGGASTARISPDGRRVWARSAASGAQAIWGADQEAPVSQAPLPAASKHLAAFTPDSQRLVVVADQEAQVWQLEPPELVATHRLEQTPDAIVVTIDGTALVCVTMIELQIHNLSTGELISRIPITLGAAVSAGLSADGTTIVIVQQPRIIAVPLQGGAVEERIPFVEPNPNYFFGGLGEGAEWAALQTSGGTDLFDVTAGQLRTTLPTGPAYVVPVVRGDGARLFVPAPEGIGVWDVASAKVAVRLTGSATSYISASADGRRVIGYRSDVPKISLWELTD